MTEPSAPSPPTPGGLLAELRRRGVVRAVVGYAVAAFAALQVSEPLLHALRLPDAWLTGVVGLLALGFPVVAAVSWFYDLTRHGWVRTGDAAPEGTTPRPSRRLHWALVTALLVVLALILIGIPCWPPWPWGPVVDADGRITVAVGDFANETRDPDLDGLSGLLIGSLEQSRRLRVLTRSRMFDLLRQLGREPVDRIDEPLAREVGRKAGARLLLLASVRKLDDLYAVELRALDPQRDEYLFTARELATSKKGLLEVVDRLSERTRRNLRESEADVRSAGEPVASTVTASLEAHRHYFQGLQLLDAYRVPEGERELQAALEVDPGFALARLQLLVGRPRSWYAPASHRELVGSLLGQLERLPDAERLIVRAEQALLDGQVEEGLARYAQAEAARPDDKRLLVRMAWAQLYLRGDPAAAVQLAERALALDPPWEPAHDALAVSLVTQGDLGRAVGLAREWAERWPSPLAFSIVTGSLLHAGDPHGALAAAQRSSELSGAGNPAGWELSRAHIQLGDLDEAERLARRGWTRGHENAPMVLASVLRFRGQRRASEKVLDDASRSGANVWRVRAQLLVGDGDPARVLARARQAGPDLPPGDLAGPLAMAGHAAEAEAWLREEPAVGAFGAAIPPRAARRMAEAVRAREGRDFAGARRILEELRAGQNRPVARQAAYVLGETCWLAGDDACAVEALSDYTPFHWMLTTTAWSWPRSLHLLSLAEERRGRRDEARTHAERLMTLWKDADPDLPLVSDAQAACRRLGCRTPAQGGGAP